MYFTDEIHCCNALRDFIELLMCIKAIIRKELEIDISIKELEIDISIDVSISTDDSCLVLKVTYVKGRLVHEIAREYSFAEIMSIRDMRILNEEFIADIFNKLKQVIMQHSLPTP